MFKMYEELELKVIGFHIGHRISNLVIDFNRKTRTLPGQGPHVEIAKRMGKLGGCASSGA